MWAANHTTNNCKIKNHQGVSIEVLRKQLDGGWRISIDSPWGGDILNGVNEKT